MRSDLQDKKWRLITNVIRLGISTFTVKMFIYCTTIIQSDQKVSVHLTFTIQKVTSYVQSVPHQSPDIY
jgi:hypothetical protein